jgi:hypothetical protein
MSVFKGILRRRVILLSPRNWQLVSLGHILSPFSLTRSFYQRRRPKTSSDPEKLLELLTTFGFEMKRAQFI